MGADGLHSSVRAQLVGTGAPVYSGYTSWRGVTPSNSVALPSSNERELGTRRAIRNRTDRFR